MKSEVMEAGTNASPVGTTQGYFKYKKRKHLILLHFLLLPIKFEDAISMPLSSCFIRVQSLNLRNRWRALP
jgi:hypothetical protein